MNFDFAFSIEPTGLLYNATPALGTYANPPGSACINLNVQKPLQFLSHCDFDPPKLFFLHTKDFALKEFVLNNSVNKGKGIP